MILLGVAAIIGAFSVFSNAIDGSGLSGYVASWQNNTTLTYWNVTYNSTNNILYAGNDKLCTVANGECLTYNWSYGGRESYNPLNDTSGNGRNLSNISAVYSTNNGWFIFNTSKQSRLENNNFIFSNTTLWNFSFTVRFYMNGTQTPSTTIVALMDNSDHNPPWSLYFPTNNTVACLAQLANSTSISGQSTASYTLASLQWTTVTCTFNSSNSGQGYTINMYVNGSAYKNANTTVYDRFEYPSNIIRIGGQKIAFPTRFFNGTIDYVGVWNKTLNSTEVTNSDSGSPTNSSLLAWYPFINQTSVASGTYKTELLISSPPPSNPVPGMLWLNIDDNKTYIRGPTNNWVALT